MPIRERDQSARSGVRGAGSLGAALPGGTARSTGRVEGQEADKWRYQLLAQKPGLSRALF